MGLNRELISQVVDRKSSLNGIGDTITVLMCDSLLKVPFLKKKKKEITITSATTQCVTKRLLRKRLDLIEPTK